MGANDQRRLVWSPPEKTDERLTCDWKERFGESVGPVERLGTAERVGIVETLGVYCEVGDWGGVFHWWP